MSERFVQGRIYFNNSKSLGAIKVAQLCELIEDHPYKDEIYKIFNVSSNLNNSIVVGNIDVLYKRILSIKREYSFYNVKSNSRDVSFSKGLNKVDGIKEDNPLIFNFSEYVDTNAEVKNNLSAYAIYESKSSFFEEFSMSKFASMLFDNGLDKLAETNLNYFKNVSHSNAKFNNYKSYRIVENNNEKFVRGITSHKYYEYGVDFTFVVSMLMIHKHMQQNTGNNYYISFAAINESKLDVIISTTTSKKAGDFGHVSSAIGVSTNDLGKGALNFVNILKLDVRGKGLYLYPTSKEIAKKNISVNHLTGSKVVLSSLASVEDFYNYVDVFIADLKEIKTIKTPDELRSRILTKISHPNSSFKEVKKLQDIFKTKIDNQIKDFAKLLDMCCKAEELDINYDLKDKLRYIISDIILNK